jgi:hypothetical protein
MAGNKVSVQMGFEDVTDRGAVFLSSFQVNVHIPLRINHGGLALRREQVRSMCQTAQVKLFEIHDSPPCRCQIGGNETPDT